MYFIKGLHNAKKKKYNLLKVSVTTQITHLHVLMLYVHLSFKFMSSAKCYQV